MGNKSKIYKHILPIMLAERKEEQFWVEPFVGGANMIDKVCGNRIGNDIHEYLIAFLSAVQNGYEPPSNVDKETYYKIKDNPEKYPKELVGFVGFLCSFGGKWWGGYAQTECGRNYADEGRRSILKQAPKLNGILFTCIDYRKMIIPNNSIVYCDPPYNNTTKYKNNFNSFEFWEWCRNLERNGHTVFVSEYEAPKDFKCIVSVDVSTTMNKNNKDRRQEKLFRYEGK